MTFNDMEAFLSILVKYAQQFLLPHRTTGFDVFMVHSYFGIIFNLPSGSDGSPPPRESRFQSD